MPMGIMSVRKIVKYKFGFLHGFIGSQVLLILPRVSVNKDEPKATEQSQPINENTQFC